MTRAMRRVFEPDGRPTYEEVAVLVRKIYVRDREGYFQGTLDGWNDE